MKISLLLATAIAVAAVAVYVATFSHAPAEARPLYALAGAWTAVAAIAPIWLEGLIFNGGTFQLAVVAWPADNDAWGVCDSWDNSEAKQEITFLVH